MVNRNKLKNKPMYDERVKEVLAKLKKGRNREDISKDYDYANYKSLDVYMRRKNFYWDGTTYVPEIYRSDLEEDIREELKRNIPVRAERIIRKIDEGVDPRELAEDEGFKDQVEMGDWMKGHNLIWNTYKKNYIYDDIVAKDDVDEEKSSDEIKDKPNNGDRKTNSNGEKIEIGSKYIDILELLYENENILKELLDDKKEKRNIPKYLVPGICKPKSVHMSNLLARLISDFAETKNISQKEIVESAVIEYFMNYGYKEEVELLLNRK